MKNWFRFLLLIGAAILGSLMLTAQCSLAQEDEEDEMHENPEARARWRFQMRANENGEIPFGAFLKAKQQIDRFREATPPRMDAGIANWEWLGPGNIGGRIRAILIHPTVPSVMWIGGVAGGIWRTNDGGGNWIPLTDFMANLAVTSIVMDPTNSLIMYASTGEAYSFGDGLQGAGVFKSVDGGYTWTQLLATNNPSFQWVTRLAHHPTTPGIVLAATGTGVFLNNTGAVYRTTDGGSTWANVLNTTALATDVEFDPTFANRAMLGTANAVYSSVDEGATWILETTGAPGKLPSSTGRCEVAFGPNGVQYVSMDRNSGEIWRTLNGGTLWSLRNTNTNYLGGQGRYANALWVAPDNQDLVVVGGLDLWRSFNGGTSLAQISRWQNFHNGGSANSAHADQHAIVHHPQFATNVNHTVFFANDGGIQMAANVYTVLQTSGWTNLANNLGITQFYGGDAATDGSIIVGGAQDNDKLHFTPANGIFNWRQPETGDGGACAIDKGNPSRIYGEYTNLVVKRSDNGGLSYTIKTNGLQDAGNAALANFIAPFTVDPNNSSTLIAGGRRIWRTTNYADNWTRIRDSIANGGMCTAIDIAPGNSSIIWVGYGNGEVSRTLDGGGTWARVDTVSVGLPNLGVTDIAINPSNSSEVFVTLGSYANNTVWLTTNNGSSWIMRQGSGNNTLPAIQVNTVRFHPSNSNWVYLGTDLGVLASEDKGQNWNVTPRFAGNEGPVNVEVDELFWQGTEYLVAATHGRGMFRARILQTVYVDINNNGFENGTFQFPYNTVQEGINAAGNGSDISIKTGTYSQTPVTFLRRGQVLPRDGTVVIQGSTEKPANKKTNDTDLLPPPPHVPAAPESVKTQPETDVKRKDGR